MTFDELKLSAPLLDAVSALGFTEAMPVQAAVIPYLLEDNIDLIALASRHKVVDMADIAVGFVLTPNRYLFGIV